MMLYELESELDREFESEFESEYENEEFFPALLPLLSAAAPVAVKAIGSLLGGGRRKRQREFEFEYESAGDPFIGDLLRGIGSSLGMSESQYEYEFEQEFESFPAQEYEVVMHELAYRAAHSESEAEAEAFLGALVPFVTRAARGIAAAAPTLIQGVSKLGQSLYQNPSTRPLLQAVPQILKQTVTSLADQRANGTPLSKEGVIRTLARTTADTLKSPQKVTKAIQQAPKAGSPQRTPKARTNGQAKRPRA